MAPRAVAFDPSSPGVLVARQPILDTRLEVAGYELLFRTAGAGPGTAALVTDADRATSEVVVDAIGELGLDRLVGGRDAYVNVSRELLLAVRPLPLPPERIVLELLEDQDVDDDLVGVARELTRDGFTLALDDFVYRPDLEPLLGLARVVKVDVLALGHDGTLEQLERLRGRGLRLVAEKVETHEEFAFCRQAGFDLFQGYFFSRPELVRGRGVPAARLGAVATLAALQQAGDDFDRLEEVISRDVGLSYKVLRYANSAFVGARAPVGTVRAALVRLGARTVQQWATMLSLASIPDRPPELTTTGLLRAQTCRLLAGDDDRELADRCFTTGLFSVLDALLGVAMEDVLEMLPLDPQVAGALLHHRGPEGEALAAVLAFERGEPATGPAAGHDVRAVSAAYGEALGWTQDVAASLA
jgi:c-di-GMP phosphodiesterase